MSGGVAERLKAHAWKACIGETLSRVRIPPPPPTSLAAGAVSARRRQKPRGYGRLRGHWQPETASMCDATTFSREFSLRASLVVGFAESSGAGVVSDACRHVRR